MPTKKSLLLSPFASVAYLLIGGLLVAWMASAFPSSWAAIDQPEPADRATLFR